MAGAVPRLCDRGTQRFYRWNTNQPLRCTLVFHVHLGHVGAEKMFCVPLKLSPHPFKQETPSNAIRGGHVYLVGAKGRSGPSRKCGHAKVYGHTTTARQDIDKPHCINLG